MGRERGEAFRTPVRSGSRTGTTDPEGPAQLPTARTAADGTGTDTGTGTDGGSGDSGGARRRRRSAGGAAGRARGRRRAKSRKRKVLRWTASVLSLLILGTAAAGYLYIEHLNGNIRSGNSGRRRQRREEARTERARRHPAQHPLIGSDSRSDPKNVALGGGKDLRDQQPSPTCRSRSHVSADRKHAAIVSIPRDTIVRIPECVGDDGTTYAPVADRRTSTRRSGAARPRLHPHHLGDHHRGLIDYWMMVDFAGVVAMADEVGGVPVCASRPACGTGRPAR